MSPEPTPDLRPVRLTFRFLPADVPPAVRLRKLLKTALRTWRMRCERVEDAPEEEEDPTHAT